MTKLEVSTLPKTWIFDLDGVLLRHNGHLAGTEEVLPGVAEFFQALPHRDAVIILSARSEHHRDATERELTARGVRFDHLVLGCPVGERVLLNDRKPSGLPTAIAVNLDRNAGLAGLSIHENPSL